MKLLTRLASPAGFALVLLLFFLVPFLSVSCDVPGVGKTGADYTGTHLVTDDTPQWQVPADLDELLGTPAQRDDEKVPAGVQVLAIALAVLAAAGVVVGLLSQVRARLYGSAGLAAATLAVTIVTMVVALANLRSALLPKAAEITRGENPRPGMDPESLVHDVLHTAPGFWFILVVLVAVLGFNAGAVIMSRRAVTAPGSGVA